MNRKLFKDGVSKDVMLVLYGMNKRCRKVVLAIMSFLMIVGSVLPSNYQVIYGKEDQEPIYSDVNINENNQQYDTTTDSSFDIRNIEIKEEVISLRTINSKTFRRVDGTYELAIYGTPVHYKENGKYKEIDNSLLIDEEKSEYKNKANAFDIKFPKTLDNNKSIKLSKDEYSIEWSINNLSNETNITHNDIEKTKSIIKELINNNDRVIYYDIFNHVDLEYIVSGNQVKENIIINEFSNDYSIEFTYKTNNVELKQNNIGEYEFINSAGNTVFSLSEFYMIDANGKTSFDIDVQVVNIKNNQYQIILSPNIEWLGNATYPVILDPTISVDSETMIQDTWLEHTTILGIPFNYNHYDNYVLACNDGSNVIGYINFEVPEFLKDFDVNYATLKLTTMMDVEGMLYLRELPYYYEDMSELHWNTKPTASTTIASNEYVNDFREGSENTYSIDITKSVKKWNEANIDEMPGFELKTDADALYGDLVFYSMDAIVGTDCESGEKPVIEIGYMDTEGIKDYWTYNSQDVSYAGTSYIADYTQDLYMIRNDFDFSTDRQSLGLNFAFSNYEVNNNDVGYGKGWNINYNLKLNYSQSEGYYTEDYSGNKVHYHLTTTDSRVFKDENNQTYYRNRNYIADDGSGTVLIEMYTDHNKTILITKDGTIYDFGNYYRQELLYLKKISHYNNDLSITIDRNSDTSPILNFVEDSSGNRLVFSYDNNILKSVTLKSKDINNVYRSIEKVFYEYYNGYLKNVYYVSDYDKNENLDAITALPHLSLVNQYASYTYQSTSHYLESAEVNYVQPNLSISLGEKVVYHYYSNTNKISYFESFFDTSKYSQVNYDNSILQTKITDHSSNYVVYRFDEYGHTIFMIDQQANMICYQYADIFRLPILDEAERYDYNMNHRVVRSSAPKSVQNYDISSDDFESGFNSSWYRGSSSTSTVEQSSMSSSVGNYSLHIVNEYTYTNGYARKMVTVDEGYYTISVDAKHNGSESSNTVYMQVGTQRVYVPNDGEWHHLSIDFFASNAMTLYTYLRSYSEGDVYFDHLKIYRSNNTSSEDRMYNPSFEEGITSNWVIPNESTTALHSNYYDVNESSYEDILGNYSVSLNGIMTLTIDADTLKDYRDDNIDAFTIGAWAKNISNIQFNNTSSNIMFGINVYQYDSEGKIIYTVDDDPYDPNEDPLSNNENYRHPPLNSNEVGFSTPTYIGFNLLDDNWQFAYQSITLSELCESIGITLVYNGVNSVLFDGITLHTNTNETINLYDDYNRITDILYEDGTSISYTYPSGTDQYTQIPYMVNDRDGNETEYSQAHNQITGIEFNNVKQSPVYNASGQMTAYHLGTGGDPDAYFTTSTTYIHSSQYLSTYTDEFGSTTTYYTDTVTGLLASINNADNSVFQYDYYDDGLLKKVYSNYLNDGVSETSEVTYIYNEYNQLKEIVLDSGYSYKIDYDGLGRMETVKVNNDTLMSYTYIVDVYGTNVIESQTYATGDTIYFNYDDENELIMNIDFQASGQTRETRFVYQYDEYGRVETYQDLIIGTTEYYHYDQYGNLDIVTYDNGDMFIYNYDEEGYLIDITCDLNNEIHSTTYDYENDDYNWLYNQTTVSGTNDINLIYGYEDSSSIVDPVYRLLNIMYKIGTTEIIKQSFDYEDYTSRIEMITYELGDNSNFRYVYDFDDLGNIKQEQYYEGTNGSYSLKYQKDYRYDGINQLIQEDLRNYSLAENAFDESNCSTYYKYDNKGNITNIEKYLYGKSEDDEQIMYIPASNPYSPYIENYGYYELDVMYNDGYFYNDIYELNLYETPSFSFLFYDLDNQQLIYENQIYIDYDLNDIDASEEGYYLMDVYAGYYGNYDLYFSVIVKVGNPVVGTLQPIEPEVSTTFNYDDEWLDQLESFTVDGTTSILSYDNQGNPTNITNFYFEGTKYHHATLSWEGRQLVGIDIFNTSVNKIVNISYTYNDQGIRTSKYIDKNGNGSIDSGDMKYDYVLSGDVLISEIQYIYFDSWVENYQIIYTYDYDGSLIGFTYYNSVTTADYLYAFNIQGDITKIINTSGVVVVEYTYDAYGNILSTVGLLESTIGEYNSMRYRGYKYDEEINMYYLNSRYYNPEIGRFINADGMLGEIGQLGTTNMYAYCANNPVMYLDISGYMPEWLLWVGVSVLAVAVVAVSVITAGAVIAAAPALASFMYTAAVAYTGSLVSGSIAATAVSVGAAVIAGSTIAIGINEGINIITGNNYLRNAMGNEVYNGFTLTVGALAYSYIVAGSIYPYPTTGNTQPNNLKSSITMNAAKKYPNSGTSLYGKVPMRDPKMPGWLGWTKYQMSFDGNTVHYVGNRYFPKWYPFQMWYDFKLK